MIWKPIRGYSGLYEISDSGEARRKWWDGRYRPIKPSQSNGYWYLTLCQNGIPKRIRRSRIVIEAFSGPSKGRQSNHKNGNKNDDSIKNLEWATMKENIQHRIKILGIRTELRRTYSNKQIFEMRRLYASGMKAWHIGVKMKINPNAVYKIVHRQSWRHI